MGSSALTVAVTSPAPYWVKEYQSVSRVPPEAQVLPKTTALPHEMVSYAVPALQPPLESAPQASASICEPTGAVRSQLGGVIELIVIVPEPDAAPKPETRISVVEPAGAV